MNPGTYSEDTRTFIFMDAHGNWLDEFRLTRGQKMTAQNKRAIARELGASKISMVQDFYTIGRSGQFRSGFRVKNYEWNIGRGKFDLVKTGSRIAR